MFPKKPLIFLLLGLLVGVSAVAAVPTQQNRKQAKTPVHITEEVEVTAEAPRDNPISATDLISRERIDAIIPRDLSQLMQFASSILVSVGTKNEYSVKIRGLDTYKVALLYDGIPIYEPYFGSFDLRSIVAEEVQDVKVIKGATSVLYGPNVLGGVINVVTRRPEIDSLHMSASYGSFDSVQATATGTVRRGRFGYMGSFTFDRSNEYKWRNSQGDHVLRANSDYRRENVTSKVYFFPKPGSEIMAEINYYHSEYGIPWATEIYNPRYWRFRDWDRLLLGLGGTFPLGNSGYFKFRSYYVRHHNILDAYTSPELSELDWESTFNNYSYGVFGVGSLMLDPRNELKFTLNIKSDHARTQDAIGDPWDTFSQDTFSTGLEDHFALSEDWTLVGGVSIDHLRKEAGNSKTAANPIAGLQYHPTDDLNFYATFSQKSRFPTMRALYGSVSGNPDLRDERGTNYEVGFEYRTEVTLSGAVFSNYIRDLIESYRLPDGYRTYINVGRARITGFELELRKQMDWLGMTVNYTYLDSENRATGRPLDLVPKSAFNTVIEFRPAPHWQINLWAVAQSRAETLNRDEVLDVPGYLVANAGVSRQFDQFELYAQVDNLLDKAYVTEPGFPMAARAFRFGLRLRLDRE